jgi:hypothetical protein
MAFAVQTRKIPIPPVVMELAMHALYANQTLNVTGMLMEPMPLPLKTTSGGGLIMTPAKAAIRAMVILTVIVIVMALMQ